MKPKVLITRKILPEALSYLDEHVDYEIGAEDRYLTKQEIIAKVEDKVGLLTLLVDEIDKEVLNSAPGLRIVANCAVGYNNIDIEFARERGVMVTNTPGVLTETTADLTWALILATARCLPAADTFVREKRFTGWELDLFLGQEVTGKRLGIIGMGRIGKAVALRAQGFRMETLYYDPQPLGKEEEKRLKAVYVPLPKLLSTSDIISLHTTLTEKTVHLISYNEFEQMKNTAIIVNVSRGPVIDEKALVTALETRQIWGAGLDVFEHEPQVEKKLLSLPNVVLLPHIGSASYETRLQMAMIAATNLVAGVTERTPPNLV